MVKAQKCMVRAAEDVRPVYLIETLLEELGEVTEYVHVRRVGTKTLL